MRQDDDNAFGTPSCTSRFRRGALVTVVAMRHGHAAASGPKGDRSRPLTEQGRTAARRMFEALSERQALPRIALVSSAVRTRETIAEALGLATIEVIYLDELYNSSPDMIEAVIAENASDRDVIVVAHNPGITAFANSGAPLAPADAVILRPESAPIHLRANEL